MRSTSFYFCAVGAAVSFVLFSVIIAASGFSTYSISNTQNIFINGFISQKPVSVVLGDVFSYFSAPLIALLFLVLGFAFLSSFGFCSEKKSIAVFAGIVGAVAAVALFKFTPLSLMVAVAIIVSSLYIVSMSNVYAKELKKWVFFRTGSSSISKAFMIFNIFVFIGIVLTVYGSLPAYQSSFKESFVESVVSVVPQNMGQVDNIDPEIARQQIRNYVESTVDSSPLLNSFLRWLPILVGFSAWIILEFLRAFIFSNIGGLFTSLLIRINKRFA